MNLGLVSLVILVLSFSKFILPLTFCAFAVLVYRCFGAPFKMLFGVRCKTLSTKRAIVRSLVVWSSPKVAVLQGKAETNGAFRTATFHVDAGQVVALYLHGTVPIKTHAHMHTIAASTEHNRHRRTHTNTHKHASDVIPMLMCMSMAVYLFLHL